MRKVCFEHPQTRVDEIVEIPDEGDVTSMRDQGFWINASDEVVFRNDQDPRFYVLPHKIHWFSREPDGTT